MANNIVNIESLDMEGRGIAHHVNEDGSRGKVIFVEGALPGEQVTCLVYRNKSHWEAATVVEVLRASTLRVDPKCPHFDMCGGCAMQHLDASAQVAVKQRVLEDNLWFIGRVRASLMMPPIYGPTWHYRYRARLSVHFVVKKGIILVGFREKKSHFVTDMKTCDVLPVHVSDMLVPLRKLISTLSVMRSLPQIEVAVSEQTTVMVLRIMAPFTAGDEEKLKAFADKYGIQWWLQAKGVDSAQPFYPNNKELNYTLPEFGITMPFKPTDFTQVNHQINRVMVARAVRLLGVQASDRVADFFCGLGNFTLPIATIAREVIGVEGSTALVARASDNAKLNGLSHKTKFLCQNLFEITLEDFVGLGKFDRILLDPPRDGAFTMCKMLVALAASAPDMLPRRIVYISCSSSTLARDAGLLVLQAGYTFTSAGVINMFPHTAHVESIAVFDLPAKTI